MFQSSNTAYLLWVGITSWTGKIFLLRQETPAFIAGFSQAGQEKKQRINISVIPPRNMFTSSFLWSSGQMSK